MECIDAESAPQRKRRRRVCDSPSTSTFLSVAPSLTEKQKVTITLEDLAEADFSWTIIDGRAYALDSFIPLHPGGPLIRRAIGEDASDLFHAHHASKRALAVLAQHEVGHVEAVLRKASPLRAQLNKRIERCLRAPSRPLPEAVAISMLVTYTVWASLAYAGGWTFLNVASSWFWWRHLDAGLHSAVHGDFNFSPRLRRILLQVYSVLCHHMLDYYQGGSAEGLSQHFQHHLYTNDLRRDPDFTVFAIGRNWIRRHACNPWMLYNQWQVFYCLAIRCLLEPISELLTMVATCVNGAVQILEAPADKARFWLRITDVASWWVEALLSPGYQGLAFFFQPWWCALGTLLLSRFVAKIVLLPFAEVQHFLMPDDECEAEDEEFIVRQLRTTANLRLGNPLTRCLDFLMFHGDSFQIEHHLWPAMSFVHLRQASKILRSTCLELGLPYHEVGYWEAYIKVWQQVREHSEQPE